MKAVELSPVQRDTVERWLVAHRSQLVDLRRSYRWPHTLTTEESLRRREIVAQLVRADAKERGQISRATAEAVLAWGFNNDTSVLDRISDRELLDVTQRALLHLQRDELEEAALAATAPDGVGISRASKILAFVDEDRFGIYDSRVGRGLADLTIDRSPLVPIPPGRGEHGTTTRPSALARGFATCTIVLREISELAGRQAPELSRPADVEMALFMRGGR